MINSSLLRPPSAAKPAFIPPTMNSSLLRPPSAARPAFKPRRTAGHLPANTKKIVSRPKIVKHLPTSPVAKMFRKKPATKPEKETAFRPYEVPKLSKPSPKSRPPPQATSTSALPHGANTNAIRDKVWSLRSYSGECMVITLTVAALSVTVRTSPLLAGFKIPPAGDSTVRDWTKTTIHETPEAALAVAKLAVDSAIDNDFTEGNCPSCNGPGRYTEAQLCEKEGLLRAGILDGRGRYDGTICRNCDREEKRIASLKHGN
ncbi:hypothetical protein TrST_g5865 [Triparma strigata]|uniref:Uncharacterized protein n=1 Tax=Triparma strigata TaxID=1606541 RepID=A0A9W7EK01_9STRA|nr:hypothetical protein TrST_g5865 [Triparma strigata]